MNTLKTYAVKGMNCASCASTIEKTFKNIVGVKSTEVNYATETVKVDFDETKTSPKELSKRIEPLGYSLVLPREMSAKEMGMSDSEHASHLGLHQSKEEKLAEIDDMKSKVVSAIPLAVFSIFLMGWDILAQIHTVPVMSFFWKEFFHHLLPVFATYTLFVVGRPYLLGVYRFLRYGKANMDTLIGIGTSAAFLYSLMVTSFEESLRPFINVDNTYYDVTIVVITFIALGTYLEARSKLKTGDAIEKLLNLQAKTALVIRDGKEVEVPLSEVIHGDVIIVKPGSKIPVDGIVISGSSFVDESMISGESMPVEKQEMSTVVAGTINTTGSFTFRATKVGSETMLAHIIKMVEDAQGSKAPIQALADKISGVFVPIVLVLAVVTLLTWILLGSHYLPFSQALSFGLVAFVGILVIACPCALGLATPTAIIVGVGKGAKEGILIKDASTLEKLHKVTVVVLDKTGTITKGKPELISVTSFGKENEHEVVAILASLERTSEHPIATALLSYARAKKIDLVAVENFISVKGKGLEGDVKGIHYVAGSSKLMEEMAISFDKQSIEKETKEGKTPVFLATADRLIGIIMVADAIKEESKEAIQALHKQGITTVMLTGDDINTAEYVARQVGIDEVVAQVTPEIKLNKIRELQSRGEVVAMAGDGVNDAPALALADVGIAMGTGTDVAIESAGVILLGGDISKLVKAINLSKITMRGIKQNLFWAFFYNIVGIPLAAGVFYPIFGWMLSPVFAGFAMAMSSVSVVSNSLRIKTKSL